MFSEFAGIRLLKRLGVVEVAPKALAKTTDIEETLRDSIFLSNAAVENML